MSRCGRAELGEDEHDISQSNYAGNAVSLNNAGIEVESYVRDSYRLIVLPEELRAACIVVKDFVLV